MKVQIVENQGIPFTKTDRDDKQWILKRISNFMYTHIVEKVSKWIRQNRYPHQVEVEGAIAQSKDHKQMYCRMKVGNWGVFFLFEERIYYV